MQHEIENLVDSIGSHNKGNIPAIHLEDKKNRLINFRHDLSEFFHDICSHSAADLSEENYTEGFKKLYLTIIGNEGLKEPEIHNLSLGNNIFIGEKQEEIEKLLLKNQQ